MDSHSPSEKMNLSESSPRRLPELSEARGKLLSVFCRGGFAVCSFAWGCVAVAEELEPQLRGLVGRTVAVLRIENRYLVRAV